ncbi:MAG: thioredoxin-dependent thiol peroxidase [Oligoflexales bacterium]|nr:thioredoxin-dependent thiol peroxidase [Oligoflexales bacterium]
MLLQKNDPAPDFNLPSNTGRSVELKSLRGKKVVLFFYPKDDTPGCTKESCDFRDLTGEFEKLNTLVFGVSADDVASHKQFSSKFSLNFPLLADTTHQTCEAYGVWGQQEWQGKKYMGVTRTTYLIDEKGHVERVFANVNPTGHAAMVLDQLN